MWCLKKSRQANVISCIDVAAPGLDGYVRYTLFKVGKGFRVTMEAFCLEEDNEDTGDHRLINREQTPFDTVEAAGAYMSQMISQLIAGDVSTFNRDLNKN